MIQVADIEWRVTFNSVDRSEIFSALRRHQPLLEQAINNQSVIDECDPEKINTSIVVTDVEQLLDSLAATAAVQCDWGRGVTFAAKCPHWTLYSALFDKSGVYQQSSCSLTPNASESGKSAMLDRISDAEMALSALRDEFRKARASQPGV